MAKGNLLPRHFRMMHMLLKENKTRKMRKAFFKRKLFLRRGKTN